MLKYLLNGMASVRWLLLLSVAFFAGIAKSSSPPTWFPDQWKPLFPWVVSNQFWLLPGPPLVVVILKYVEHLVGKRQAKKSREYQLQRLLEELLERLRERFIPTRLRREPPPHHRLTLFRANRKQMQLEMVARSAEATRGSTTCWRIHPDEQSQCEGVAGVAWYLDTMLVLPGAGEPDLPDVTGNCDETTIENYARRTFVSAELIREHRWTARSFAAMTIRVDGKKWGVLVLDSVSTRGAQQRIIVRMAFAADMLGDIIKRWSSS